MWATLIIPKQIYWAFCGLQFRTLFCCIICVFFNVVFLLVNLPSSWEAKCSAIANTVCGKSLKLQCNRLQSLLSILNTLASLLSEAGCVHVSYFTCHLCHFSMVTNQTSVSTANQGRRPQRPSTGADKASDVSLWILKPLVF